MGNPEQDIVQLAASVTTLGEACSEMYGHLQVITCALAALVRSHPDPDAFATAFRRA